MKRVGAVVLNQLVPNPANHCDTDIGTSRAKQKVARNYYLYYDMAGNQSHYHHSQAVKTIPVNWSHVRLKPSSSLALLCNSVGFPIWGHPQKIREALRSVKPARGLRPWYGTPKREKPKQMQNTMRRYVPAYTCTCVSFSTRKCRGGSMWIDILI